MRADHGTRIGYGVGCGIYPTSTSPALAKLRIGADASTVFATSGHECSQGIRTCIANALVEQLGADPNKLIINIRQTRAAPQHVTVGSWGTFSAVPVMTNAIAKLRARLDELAAGRTVPDGFHAQLASFRRLYLEVEASYLGAGQNSAVLEALRRYNYAIDGPEFPDFVTMSFIAHFVEIRIAPRTGRLRMTRVVSVADCGRVVSPRTVPSQVISGVVWAFGAATRESTETDPQYGGFLNNDLADYVVPVSADIGDISVEFVD